MVNWQYDLIILKFRGNFCIVHILYWSQIWANDRYGYLSYSFNILKEILSCSFS